MREKTCRAFGRRGCSSSPGSLASVPGRSRTWLIPPHWQHHHNSGHRTQGLALRERSEKKNEQKSSLPKSLSSPEIAAGPRQAAATWESTLLTAFLKCSHGRKLLQLPAAGKCLFLLFFLFLQIMQQLHLGEKAKGGII